MDENRSTPTSYRAVLPSEPPAAAARFPALADADHYERVGEAMARRIAREQDGTSRAHQAP